MVPYLKQQKFPSAQYSNHTEISYVLHQLASFSLYFNIQRRRQQKQIKAVTVKKPEATKRVQNNKKKISDLHRDASMPLKLLKTGHFV